jgi:voltage-dependent potassium channel beta subunit
MVEKDTMVYKNLGNSGLKVSALSIGNWLNGHNLDVEETQMKVFSKFIDAGVNFLDTAEIYGFGNAETILGKTLKAGGWNRDELVISTKFIRADMGNGVGLSRKRLVQAMRNSLKRLQLDYVDIMFLHRFDHEVPLEETVRAVNHLIEQGKASYWGTSEFTALQLMEVYKICDRYGYDYPIAEQCQYSMYFRESVEVNYTELFDRYGLGTTIWSPLSGGILSGKYNDGNFPEASRLADPGLHPQVKARYLAKFNEENKPKTVAQLQGLKSIADELGISQSQLCLAWCMKNPDVSTAITGATSLAQAEDSVKAVEAIGKLDSSVLLRIEELLGNRPTPHTDYRTYKPLPPRR